MFDGLKCITNFNGQAFKTIFQFLLINTFKNFRTGPMAQNEANPSIIPIAALNLYQGN